MFEWIVFSLKVGGGVATCAGMGLLLYAAILIFAGALGYALKNL